MIRKKFFYSLIIFASVLLLVNIYLEYVNSGKEETVVEETNRIQIERVFLKTLNNCGIEESWIKTKESKNKNDDSLRYVYYVDVPTDLPIVNIISDLVKYTEKLTVSVLTEEKKNYSNTVVKVNSNNKLKLLAYLNHSKTVQRKFAEITFIVEGFDIQSEDDMLKASDIIIPFTILFVPSKDLKENLVKLKDYNCNYSILLNDDIDESSFELNPDDTKTKLKSNLVNIISTFGRDIVYVIDDNSELYSSVAINFILDELDNRKVSQKKRSDFVDLYDKPLDQTKSIFEFQCTNGKSGERRFLLIDFDSFIQLQGAIAKQKKQGDRFFLL